MSIADPMDIAYLALGAKQSLIEFLKDNPAAEISGELEYIGQVIQYAPLLDVVWKEVEEQWEACWAYEVAEPIGAALGRAALTGALNDKEADLIVRRIVSECLQETLH